VDDTWAPLWFGNERADKQENSTYGTARVVQGLAALGPRWSDRVLQMMADGGRWFVGAQNSDGGWGGDCGVPSSIEETALAVEALAALAQAPCPHTVEGLDHAIARGVGWLVERTDRGRAWPAAPIGLYFAKLWYFERLYPPIFTVGALGRVRNLPEQA
jgi:squalene-hopene/tetraprenyl-beta-curcumene cyclase